MINRSCICNVHIHTHEHCMINARACICTRVYYTCAPPGMATHVSLTYSPRGQYIIISKMSHPASRVQRVEDPQVAIVKHTVSLNYNKCFFTPGSPYPPGAGRASYLDLVRIRGGYISSSFKCNEPGLSELTSTAATFSIASSLVRTGVPRAIMRRKLYVLQPRPHFITPRASSRNTQRS